MQITDQMITKLAGLSNLSFTGEEREHIKKDLESMIAFADKLNQLNTAGVEPLLHLTENINVFKTDVAKNELTTEQALLNAPVSSGSFFIVPKTVRKPK
jgi:aspartyl-tRNA(Asn)/glutamyl-tRNA(Gln) amidotransferase subunit C